jgi:hypothetical protein
MGNGVSYAKVVDDAITETRGSLPNSARRLDTQEWVMGLATAPLDLQQATGWYEVIETPRPDDTDTTTYDRSIELVGNLPTEVWTARPKTQDELDADAATENRSAIQTNLEQDMLAMQAILDATNATINSNPATHIKNIARMNKRLGRTALNDYTGTD